MNPHGSLRECPETNARKEGGFIMLTPNQFRVNEVWIAFRVNESFMFVQDEPYDIYLLIDAASAYAFGHVLVRVTDEIPKEKDVDTLFQEAWGAKRQWPRQLIFPEDDPAQRIFRMQAEKNGLSFETVSLSNLSPIVEPMKELFASQFG
jgi:hypothetical protein